MAIYGMGSHIKSGLVAFSPAGKECEAYFLPGMHGGQALGHAAQLEANKREKALKKECVFSLHKYY